MYMLEKTRREDRFLNHARNPSFSSTLLDKIYRSIDEGEIRKSAEMKFYRETTGKKQSRTNGKCNSNRNVEDEASLRRACLLEKWMDSRRVSQMVGTQGRKLQHDQSHDREQDVLFFSSTSSSSDSSSGGLSSSDTESMIGVRSRASCFAPSRPKPVRTRVPVSVRSERSEKTLPERRHSALFHREQKGMQMFDGFSLNSNTVTERVANNEEGLIKSKSRALKIYNNLKKVKQPISPGGKLTNFLNSLFTTGHAKKTKSASTSSSSVGGYEELNAKRKTKSGQASTCSSASSFSRSCLSKTSTSSGEKLRSKGVKRTVRFYPVSVIVDEDSRPCGHKCLYEEQDTRVMSVSVPTAWKIGRSPTITKKNNEEELKFPVMEKEYHPNQKKSDLILRDFPITTNVDEEEEEEDDDDDDDEDAVSCSSSDLFELDHLAVMGNDRYCEELPVYETTHVSTNRAIANGLIT